LEIYLDSVNIGKNLRRVESFWCLSCQELHDVKQMNAFRRLGLFGLPVVRLVEWQKGRCPVCRKPLCLAVPNSWNVDHDHTCCPSGRFCEKCVRGVLCGLCNRMLGLAKDNTKILRQGATYLSRWKMRKIPIKKPLRLIHRIADDKLAKLYGGGLSIKELAEKFECSPMTVHRRLKKSGMPLRPRGPRHRVRRFVFRKSSQKRVMRDSRSDAYKKWSSRKAAATRWGKNFTELAPPK